MAYVHIVQLEILFSCDFEHLEKEISKIKRAICRRCWRLDHAKRCLTLAVMTTELPEHLLDRLRPTLDQIVTVQDYRSAMAPKVVFGKHGEMDPTRSFLKEAWRAAMDLNYPKKFKPA